MTRSKAFISATLVMIGFFLISITCNTISDWIKTSGPDFMKLIALTVGALFVLAVWGRLYLLFRE